MTVRRVASLGAGLLAALIVPAAGVPPVDIDKEFHHTFPAPRGTTLHVVHGDGDLILTPWDRDVIEVLVRYRAQVQKIGWGDQPDFNVEFRKSGSTAHVIGREKGGVTVGFFSVNLEEYVYEIQAPSHVILDLAGEDGDVGVTGWRAEIHCRLDDGNVTLKDIEAPEVQIHQEDGNTLVESLRGDFFLTGEDGEAVLDGCELPKASLHLEDGDVMLKATRAHLDLDLEDGDAHLSRMRLTGGTLRTVDGDVDLELLQGDPVNLDIGTQDGAVRVDLDPGTSVVFSVRTQDGRVRVDLPGVVGLREEGNRVTGEWNGGRGRLRITTVDGSVDLGELLEPPQ